MTSIEIPTTVTREGWMHAAVEIFRPRFAEVGYPLPEKIHMSVGFAYGARRESAKILGQAWSRAVSSDGVNHMFVSPESGDPVEILETILHELIHVALDLADGHKGRFAEIATRLGFMGPMTSTPSSVELAADLMVLSAELGDFPHGAMTIPAKVPTTATPGLVPAGGVSSAPIKYHTGPATQTNRNLKLVCAEDGYAVRTSRSMVETHGFPFCPKGHPMEWA